MDFVDDVILRDVPFIEHDLRKLFLIQIAIDIVGHVTALCREEKGLTGDLVIVVNVVQGRVDGLLGLSVTEIDVRIDEVDPAWFHPFDEGLEHLRIDLAGRIAILSPNS